MKTKLLPQIIFGFAAIAAITAVPRASAVPISFSGGNGTPISLTLSQSISYTMTAAGGAGSSPLFVFQNVNPFGNSSYGSSGSMTFSVNGGAPQSLSFMSAGFSFGVVTANDFLVYGALPGLNVGDVVVLNLGTLTTQVNVPGTGPANGSFNTFITAFGSGAILSSFGTVGTVPESLSTLWLGLPLLGMFAARRLRTGGRKH